MMIIMITMTMMKGDTWRTIYEGPHNALSFPSPHSLVFRHSAQYPVLRNPQLITAFTVNKNTS